MLYFVRRMIEVWSEPKHALTDLAMAQWEEASVITVRGNVAAEGMPRTFRPSIPSTSIQPHSAMPACTTDNCSSAFTQHCHSAQGHERPILDTHLHAAAFTAFMSGGGRRNALRLLQGRCM